MIKIICVGKLKEKYLFEAEKEYIKRIKKYTNIELIEIDDCKIDDPVVALQKEEKSIEKYLIDKDFIITLEIDGNQLDSIEFSKKLDSFVSYNKNVVFLIGGSHGLSDMIKNKSNYKLSFSKLTFPHQLFRIMLLEQIYRGYKILNNERYHK